MVKGKPATMGLMAWQGKDWGTDASIVKLLKTAGGAFSTHVPTLVRSECSREFRSCSFRQQYHASNGDDAANSQPSIRADPEPFQQRFLRRGFFWRRRNPRFDARIAILPID